jgi:phosphatidylglycerophosphate synthase
MSERVIDSFGALASGASRSSAADAPVMSAPVRFQEAQRELSGLTAGLEKRLLTWLAARLPGWVNPDHLTALGLFAMGVGGASYALAGRHPSMLLLVNLALALNWFGDSLDGTLARHRQTLRPRWGFYVDHLVDVVGALLLLLGTAISGVMSLPVAAALLVAYYLVNLEIYLATYTLGRFKISHGLVGGTEIRILLALVNLAALAWPVVEPFGVAVRLFDVVGVVATLGLLVAVARTAAANGRALYEQERLPSP